MSGGVALGLALAAPLLLAIAVGVRGLRKAAAALAPWSALPALALAVGGGAATVEWSRVLLGMRLASGGAVTSGFLALTAALWLVSGLFARTYLAADPARFGFWAFWLATLAGNLGVVLAADVASFYLFYALMTFAAYGLVVHDRGAEARRAGRVYLVMALGGELLLLAAFLAVVGPGIDVALEDVPRVVAGSAHRDLLAGLLLAGFGVKAGALGLHLWLPLAHPVAPPPASAVLSGAMIKAGLLGWLRFLPLGVAALPAHGAACVAAGLAAALYGVAIGLTQRDPKTVLAYSSVSQMGLLIATLGIALAVPGAAPAAVAAIVFYALHHAATKGALFLGTAVARDAGPGLPARLVTAGLWVSALGLAGVPLTTGALAKLSLKHALEAEPWGAAWLPGALSVAAVGTALLVIHFLRRARPGGGAGPAAGLWVPWALLVVLDLGLLAAPWATEDARLLVAPAQLGAAAWPALAALVLAAGASLLPPLRLEVPPGDVLHLVEAAVARLRRIARATRDAAPRVPVRQWIARLVPGERHASRGLAAVERADARLSVFPAIGLLFVLLVVLLWAAQLLPAR